MALDLDRLLAPVSDESPVGPDLSYDPERQEIERAFENNDAADGEAGDDRDWRAVLRLIESQFGQTKDLWLPVYLCRAGAKSGSLETVETGAQALAGLMEQYWDSVHPQLDELGLPGRKAPCDSLASRGEFLMPLERVVLVAHPRLGSFTGQDIERFRSEKESADGYGMFRACLEELGDTALEEARARLDGIEQGLRRADKVFTDAAAGEPSPNYSPTYAALAMLKQALGSFLSVPVEAEAAGEEGGAGEAAAPRGKASVPGRIDNRQDVAMALDAIADYYRRNEPSHPMSLLAMRAKDWVNMDFMALMREIAPDSIFQANQLLNKREE